MKDLFKKKKKSKPSPMACNNCGYRKVGCHAPLGIGTRCRTCTNTNRVCEWPLTPGQDLATTRRSKGPHSCTTCKARKMRCNPAPGGVNKPCGTCALDGLPCSFAEVAAPTHAEQPVAGPSNQGMAAGLPHYRAPQHQFGDGAANGAYPPSLAIDTSSAMAGDSGGSVTPSSGPSSPRSYWETVLNQEYSME